MSVRLNSNKTPIENIVQLINQHYRPPDGSVTEVGDFTLIGVPQVITPSESNQFKNTSLVLRGNNVKLFGEVTTYYNRIEIDSLKNETEQWVLENKSDFSAVLNIIYDHYSIDPNDVTVVPNEPPKNNKVSVYKFLARSDALLYIPDSELSFEIKSEYPPPEYLALLKGAGVITSNVLVGGDSSGKDILINRITGASNVNASNIDGRSPTLYGGTTSTSSNQQLAIPENQIPAFGTGDFTVECWIYCTSNAATVQRRCLEMSSGTSAIYTFYLARTGIGWSGTLAQSRLCLVVNNGGPVYLNSDDMYVLINTWHHVAICRENGTVYWFLDGSLRGTFTDTRDFPSTRFTLFSGPFLNNDPRNMPGYIDDFAVCRSAKYVEDFTPVTEIVI